MSNNNNLCRGLLKICQSQRTNKLNVVVTEDDRTRGAVSKAGELLLFRRDDGVSEGFPQPPLARWFPADCPVVRASPFSGFSVQLQNCLRAPSVPGLTRSGQEEPQGREDVGTFPGWALPSRGAPEAAPSRHGGHCRVSGGDGGLRGGRSPALPCRSLTLACEDGRASGSVRRHAWHQPCDLGATGSDEILCVSEIFSVFLSRWQLFRVLSMEIK